MPYTYETERKFLVSDPSVIQAGTGTSILQGFLAEQNGRTVRVRLTWEQATLTIKQSGAAIRRAESEHVIDRQLAHELIHMCDPHIVRKDRYPLIEDDLVWVVDVFTGPNEGLLLAELEMHDNSDIVIPAWCGEEVTGDLKYYNEYLAYHPYQEWST